MPLTTFQRKVARLLAANRQPESHVAGGAVINRSAASYRYSDDLDIFHDAAANVAAAADADARTLLAAGYAVDWVLRGEGMVKAMVSQATESLRLDWTSDSAFRFFPVQPDEDFGYVLHPADLATNKVLALAGRTEIRDFLDMLLIDATYLSLGAAVWAACGKDAGFTPALLLDQANRHSRFQESDLLGQRLAQPIDLKELKKQWIEARDHAETVFGQLPGGDLGCLYLDQANQPVTPDPASPDFGQLRRHFGSVRGAWPVIS